MLLVFCPTCSEIQLELLSHEFALVRYRHLHLYGFFSVFSCRACNTNSLDTSGDHSYICGNSRIGILLQNEIRDLIFQTRSWADLALKFEDSSMIKDSKQRPGDNVLKFTPEAKPLLSMQPLCSLINCFSWQLLQQMRRCSKRCGRKNGLCLLNTVKNLSWFFNHSLLKQAAKWRISFFYTSCSRFCCDA